MYTHVVDNNSLIDLSLSSQGVAGIMVAGPRALQWENEITEHNEVLIHGKC